MRRRECRRNLLQWCIEALSPVSQTPAAVHRLLITELDAVARGEIDRLMIFMPPNSAKTTYASKLFPPWFMAQKPNQHIIGASHGSEYAEDLSREVIRYARENRETLDFDLLNDSPSLWRTTNGCVYRAAGAGGSITGRRADLFLIDDPIKGREDADSLKIRDKVWNWYRAEVLTRLNPGARILLIQTRWHEDDLAGRLLEEMKVGGDRWRIVNLPAIAEDADDALGRAIGDALWPDRFSLETLKRTRAGVGEREWAALYQQRPRPLEGTLFKIAKIDTLEVAPNLRGAVVGSGWDFGATKQVGTRDPDWTSRVKMARLPSGLYVVLDVFRDRGGPDENDAWLRNVSTQDRMDHPGVKISIPQDPAAAGKTKALADSRILSGFNFEVTLEGGEKTVRATPVISQVNAGNVAIVKGPWNRAFRDELASFPGAKDDQVDALSRAFSIVGLGPRPLVFSPDVLKALAQR